MDNNINGDLISPLMSFPELEFDDIYNTHKGTKTNIKKGFFAAIDNVLGVG